MFNFTKRKTDCLYLLILIFTLVISGCTTKQKETTSKKEENDPAKNEMNKDGNSLIPPLEAAEGEFLQVIGWIDQNTICYLSKSTDSYKLFTYNIYSGEHKSLYSSENEIYTVKISPQKSKLLVYTFTEGYNGKVYILDTKGNIQYNKELETYDIEFVWNPYNENEIMVSTFSKDWDSKEFLLSIEQETWNEINLQNPFPRWLNKNEVAYINWNQSSPSLHAEIWKMNLETGEENEEESLSEAYHVDTLQDGLLTITSDENNSDEASYTFYNQDLQPLSTLTVPRLSKYTDWLIPFNDAVGDTLFTLVPIESGYADTYTEGFELLSIQSTDGKIKKWLNNKWENQPIEVSQDMKWCLYGYYYEQVINLETGEVFSLFNEHSMD